MTIEVLPEKMAPQFKPLLEEMTADFFQGKEMPPDTTVTFHFVSKEEIQKLNQKYRHVDKPTDVLSFPIFSNPDKMIQKSPNQLGDIFICLEMTPPTDLERLVRHSLNHLVGKHH